VDNTPSKHLRVNSPLKTQPSMGVDFLTLLWKFHPWYLLLY